MVSITENDIKNIKKYFKLIIIVLLFLFFFIKKINADAWLQQKGKGIFIVSLENKMFNGANSLGIFDKNKKIYQNVFNFYGEYGLTNRITLGAKILAVDSMNKHNNKMFNHINNRAFALDTTILFTRIGIIKNNKRVALSIVGQIGAPSVYKETEVSFFTIQKWHYEPRLELGVNISNYDFLTFTIGYHKNINHWYDEIRGELMYGHYFGKSLLVMLRFQKYGYIVTNKKNKDTYLLDLLQTSGFAKINLSVAVPITKLTTIEFGVYTSIKAKITFTKNLNMDLYGIYFSFWHDF